MERTVNERLERLERVVARVVDGIAVLRKSQKPKPKAAAPAAPPRELTELEQVQRDFEFLREHGGVRAEGRYDHVMGQFQWRYRR